MNLQIYIMSVGKSPSSPISAVSALLDSDMRVELSDGRRVIGRFICLDSFGNILLKDSREWQPAGAADASKRLGLTMVPAQHLVKCEVAEAVDR